MGLTATLTQGLRASYPNGLDKNEDRLSQYGGWEAFVNDTNSPDSIINQEVIAKAKMSAGNSLAIPVINGDDITITNVRSCTISDYENTSALVTVTFSTYQFGFTMVPSQYKNNDIAYQADWNNKMKKMLKKMAATLDSAAIAKLEADKTAVMNSTLIGEGSKYGALVGDAVQVSSAQKNLFFNDLSTIMAADDFYGRFNVVGSNSLRSTVNYLVNQGNANAENNEFQFGSFDFGYSNRVAVTDGSESSLYCMPKGTLATVNRNDPDSIMGSTINSENYFEEVFLPIINLKMGSHYFKSCSDESAIVSPAQNQLKAAVKEAFIFSTDVAFLTAYNSDPVTLPGAIHKADINVGI